MMHINIDLFEFILFGFCWASYMYEFMFFINVRKFQPLFLCLFVFPPFCLCAFSGIPIAHMLVQLKIWSSFYFSSFFFLFLRLDHLYYSILLYSNLLIFFTTSSNMISSRDRKFFIGYTFQLKNFCLVFVISIFLIILSIWKELSHFFNSLDIVFLISLNIRKK